MAAKPETADQERDRLRKELANERADCAVAIEAVTFLLDQTDYFINTLFGGELPNATAEELAGYETAHALLAKLGASK